MVLRGLPVGEQGAAGHEGALSIHRMGLEGPGFRPGPSFCISGNLFPMLGFLVMICLLTCDQYFLNVEGKCNELG